MSELIRFKWQSFDPLSGTKIAIGLIVMMMLTKLTGKPWLATALVAMFAWFANVPGSLKDRIIGLVVFAAGALVLTLFYGWIGLSLLPNVMAIIVVGFLGTAALLKGMRAFMIGFSMICWGIYGPFLVETTSVGNCILAIVVGTGVIILLIIIGEVLGNKNTEKAETEAPAPPEESSAEPGVDYIFAYAITVSLVLALTTYYGWVELKTDPTLMVGGAFFVIGFDVNKTWIAGIGRVMGLLCGALLGLMIAKLLGPGLVLQLVMIAACGLSFSAGRVHPGAWMFFFMIFVAIGWQGLKPETFDLTVIERFYGELVGIGAAMIAIVFLGWWQNRHS